MALDNVVPIDAEAARLLDRRNTRFRWFVAVLAALWIGILIPVLLFTPLPPLGPFALLAVLVVLAEHRFVLFGDETSMSASIVVVIASVFVFADSSPLAGPMLIASLGGLYLPHLVHGESGKAAFNGLGMGLAAVVPSLVAHYLMTRVGTPLAIASIVAAVTWAYWCANNLIVAAYQCVVGQQVFTASARQLLTSDTEILAWAGVAALGVAIASNAELPQMAFLIAMVALRIAVHDGALIPSQRANGSGPDPVSTTRLVVWMAALAVLTFSEHPTSIEFTFALTITALVGWMPISNLQLPTVVAPVVTIAAFGTPNLSALLLTIAVIAAFASRAPNAPKWNLCIALGGTTYIASIHATSVRNILAGYGYVELVTTVLIPCLFAVVLFATGVARAVKFGRVPVALGTITPTRMDIAALAAVVVAGLASRANVTCSLALVTAYFIARASKRRVSGQRSSQAASR